MQAQSEGLWKPYSRQAEKLFARGDYEAALEPAQKALELAEKESPQDPYAVSFCLNDVAAILTNRGEYTRAEPLYQRALQIRESHFSNEPEVYATSLNNLADFYRKTGEYAKARPLFEKSLQVAETTGPSLLSARAAHSLANLYRSIGDYARAQTLYKRTLEICRFALQIPAGMLPEEQRQQLAITYADALRESGATYLDMDKLEEGEAALTGAYRISKELLGSDHPSTGFAISELGRLDSIRAQYRAAEAKYRLTVAIMAKRFGLAHTFTATAIEDLAGLYESQGATERAEWMYEYARDIQIKAVGPNHPSTVEIQSKLAGVYAQHGQYDLADDVYQKALRIQRKAYPPGHAAIADTLLGICNLNQLRGDMARAEEACGEALGIVEGAFGAGHPETAGVLNSLASIRMSQHRYAESEQLYRRSLAITRQVFPQDHPRAGAIILNLATLLHAEGKQKEAGENFRAALANQEVNLARSLDTGSELLKEAYVRSLSGIMDQLVTYAVAAPSDTDAVELAFSVVLRRKGRVLESIAAEMASLRRRATPEGARLMAELAQVRSALSNLLNQGPKARPIQEYQSELGDLARKEDNLQQEISLASGAQAAPGQETVTREGLQTALPPRSAAIEFVYYRPFLGAEPAPRHGEARYAAFVLLSSGHPHIFDLGSASEVNELCHEFALSLSSPANSAQTKEIARELFSATIGKFRSLLPDDSEVFVSPDSDLNLIPFAALRDTDGKYLVRSFRFAYMTSSRDLLRLGPGPPNRESAVAVASPDFGPKLGTGCAFEARPGFHEEAALLQSSFPGSRVIEGEAASKPALFRIAHPKLLLIATHGFFDKSGVCAAKDATPMMQAGLALAGANRVPSGGIVTALEITALDLLGTELVVLSGCESGIGDVFSGDGVFGMRRALAIAGARTQLLTLWKVDDTNTRVLMTNYFALLAAGKARSEALQRAQLDMQRAGMDPYYWAAFVQSGDWRPLAQ